MLGGPMARDLYEILGVRRSASAEAIKRAYRRLVKRYHPDLNPHRGASEMFLDGKEAYEVLSNPPLRREHDEKLGIGSGGPSAARPDDQPPRKVRVPTGYVRVSPPFRSASGRIERVGKRNPGRRSRKAQTIWRIYVVTAASMTGSLGVFGGYLLTMGATFQGAGAIGSAGMVFALRVLGWGAEG